MNTQQCVQTPNVQTPNMKLSSMQIPSVEISRVKSSNSLFNLFEMLPLTGIWIANDNPDAGGMQHVYYSPDAVPFSTDSVEYLNEYIDSEQWLTDQLITAQMAREGILLDLEIPEKTTSYPYLFAYDSKRFGSKDLFPDESNPTAFDATTVSGCWLVWAQEHLSLMHRYCIRQQMQYLCISQENHQVKAQLHQQVRTLQKTLSRAEHQLRTPLSLIELCADLLYKNVATPPLKAQAQFICKTVDDMNLSLQRLTHWDDTIGVERALCDLKQVLSEAIESLRIPLEQHQIKITSESRSVMLKLDAWKIKQVFSNLFSNAIAFSPTGSTISCNWYVFQREVLIEICDQGPGFSAEDLAALFTPFYSRRHNGTGLGMVIAKDIISAHQGRLWVANQPNGGAAISIALPRL